ncbi:MAG: ATP-binding protein [Methanomicrobiales archaeon]|nr:ATP-binding protein [Methanomicrobiales archaeon]
MSVFINRTRELANLRERYESRKAEFIVLYGRRRVGKSELIDQFLSSHHGIRILAREESKSLQLRRLAADLCTYFKDPFLRKTGFADWDSVFEYLLQHAGERVVIAFDEFPYLVAGDSSLPSILQGYWDGQLKDTGVFLILSGSSISMMESITMAYGSPLFGRRTGQILLSPLRFIHALDYLQDLRKSVEFYAVFGGTPAYIMAADPGKDIMSNIASKVLREDSFLFRDVEFVLRSELVEPRYYFSILFSLAQGNHSIGLIGNDTGLSKSVVNKYLSVLIDLHLVHRRIPVTESIKSRKGLYYLSDNLFDFWFKFVNPYLDTLERGNTEIILEQYVKPQFPGYVGKHFEAMVMDLFDLYNQHSVLPFVFTQIGSWWHQGEEIDIVVLREDEQKIMFCECKWQDDVNGERVFADLTSKASGVSWHNDRRLEFFCVVARSFSRRPPMGSQCLTLDLNDLMNLFVRCRQEITD